MKDQTWFEYQAAKRLPKPAYQRKYEPPPQPIEVEESFADTIIQRAFKFWAPKG